MDSDDVMSLLPGRLLQSSEAAASERGLSTEIRHAVTRQKAIRTQPPSADNSSAYDDEKSSARVPCMDPLFDDREPIVAATEARGGFDTDEVSVTFSGRASLEE
jgi:hypothetical protein